MKLIVGLGNPGKQYEKTRHNAGFMLLDAIAKQYNSDFKDKSKFKALIAEVNIEEDKVLLVKPTAYYNLSGDVTRNIKDFYKIENEDILVIHDDMALPFGTLRTRFSGRDAGNNGVKSLNQHIGYDYARVRVGIWSEHRQIVNAHDFVLGKLSNEEQKMIEEKLALNVIKITKQHVAGTLEAHTA